LAASVYAGATHDIAAVEQPSRLDSSAGVDLAQWQRVSERAPRYAASALALTFQVTRGRPWLAGAAAQARFFFRKSIVRCQASWDAALS
ncbi:MAG TPA: hypothetical protein VGI39_13765, partial [Polyangiaceae bacterium]